MTLAQQEHPEAVAEFDAAVRWITINGRRRGWWGRCWRRR
ncbi:hypothetical protein BJY21_003293 [Kineosphaera limosa]|nr:hypothetical protein [Kineosphaera limosa]